MLRLLNPNPEPLRLHGAVYLVRLDGHKIIEGVANDLAELMNQPRDHFEYSLSARLNPVGFARNIRIEESGRIDLRTNESR